MKKFTKLIALMLVLCMFAALALACNNMEEPTEAPTSEPTEAEATNKPTSKPTEKATEEVTNSVNDNFKTINFYELVDYVGKDFDADLIDIGQSSLMYVIKNTNKEEYEDFKKQLYDAGCYPYTTYTEGDHQYATFVTKTQILHTMLLHYNYDENE